ncbi:Transcriptional activator of fatty acid utilization [Elasticomyces elasticus]|nr:Transcriptional activator of fatty acid utilization [Elasticomyces elasticus]
MPPAGSPESKGMNIHPEEITYPSRIITYQAAGMITSIIEALQVHDQLRYTPAFIVYSLFSALIINVYQTRSSNQNIVSGTQQRLTTCMTALRDVSKVWLVAKMVRTLFESILGNKVLEERPQKAAGRKHNKPKHDGLLSSRTSRNTPLNERAAQQGESDNTNRKFDEMELGYVNGSPAARTSYERSRLQNPVPAILTSSPPVGHSTDTFMDTTRVNTRPTTYFDGVSYAGTPPDFFLHTRGKPKTSEDLWQNYDQGQLFPPEANDTGVGSFSPGEDIVDPALWQPTHSLGGINMSDGEDMHPAQQLPAYHQDPQGWAQLQADLQAQQQQHHQRLDDHWSAGPSTGQSRRPRSMLATVSSSSVFPMATSMP